MLNRKVLDYLQAYTFYIHFFNHYYLFLLILGSCGRKLHTYFRDTLYISNLKAFFFNQNSIFFEAQLNFNLICFELIDDALN